MKIEFDKSFSKSLDKTRDRIIKLRTIKMITVDDLQRKNHTSKRSRQKVR